MQATMTRIHEPAKAKEYFESKLAFTTGPIEVDQMIESGENNITIVDVRASEDYAKGHIPGAINLPKEKWTSFEGLRKDKTNIVYCYSQVCHLAAKTCLEFAGRGYPVMEMDGGFKAWEQHELDIEHEPVDRVKKSGEKRF
jgi:rhodanese-related sulfurtransferase